MKVFITVITLLVLLFCSCKRKDASDCQYESIIVDIKNSRTVDISDNSIIIEKIPLELTDNSLLTYIEGIEIEDGRIFIYDAHRIIVFDMLGNFLYHMDHKGGGPGEYTNIHSFFLENNKCYLYDSNIQTMFVYNKNNIYETSKKTTEMMASIYPVGNGMYVGKRKYQGDNIRTPTLAVLNQDLELYFNVSNRNLTTGVGVFDYCFSYDNNILYWEFLNDTIYTVKGKEIGPAFFVNFKEFRIPEIEKKGKTISEIIEFINLNPNRYATGIRYVQEDLSNVRFIFAFDEGVNYVRYNKQTKETSQYRFFDSTASFQFDFFMKYHDGKIILSVNDSQDVDSNPMLLLIEEQ